MSALVPPHFEGGEQAARAASSSSGAPSAAVTPPSDLRGSMMLATAPPRQGAPAQPRASLLDTSWVSYPSSGPPVSHISAFLTYTRSIAPGKVLLDVHQLHPMAQGVLAWLAATHTNASNVHGLQDHVPGFHIGGDMIPGHGNNTPFNRSFVGGGALDIAGATCKLTQDGAGYTWPIYIILLATLALLVLDITNCCGFDMSRFVLSNRHQSSPMPAVNETGSPTTSTDTGRSPEAESDEADTGKSTEAVVEDEGDDAPKTIDMGGWIIIGFTIIPAVVGDLYFTMLAPFLPGVMGLRGFSNALTGLVFSMQPLGSLFTAPWVPWALRQPWGDPYVMVRLATTVTALVVSCTGLMGKIPIFGPTHGQHGASDTQDEPSDWNIVFIVLLCCMRFIQGCCVTVLEVCNESISLMLLPRDKIGPVQGVIMATRVLGVILGPVLGGFLYQAGCWAMPFTAGSSLLFCSVFALMIGLGRRAPKKLKSKKAEMTAWQLLKVGDTLFIALPMLVVCMETSLMEPAWQGFLGRPPFNMSPPFIGFFLNEAVIIYMVVLIFGGMCLGTLGPAIQYLVGAILSGIGLLFMGPSPWFGTAVPETQGIVLMGTMICYAGVAFFVPATVPLALDVFERAGYQQKQVAGVSSAMFTIIICSANFVGPPLGGMLIDALGGVPIVTTYYSVTVIAVSLLCVYPLCKYAKRLDKDIAKACMSDEEKAIADKLMREAEAKEKAK